MQYSLILLLSAFTLLSSCRTQTTGSDINIEQANRTNNRLLPNNIMVIHQDQKDNYWFGSWNSGVYKYNGDTVIHYNTSNGLANDRIDAIDEDAAGNIYITSCHPKSTIVKFDGSTMTTLEAVPSEDWQLNATDMWFKHAYRNEKVYRYDGETLHELILPKPPHLYDNFEVYSIYKDRMSNVWFGTNPVGVCRYDGSSFDWITEEDVTEFRDEGANGVRSMVEDKNGDFWFNTEQRYTIYDSSLESSGQFYMRHQSIGSLDGITDSPLDEYLSSVVDDEGNLWFVTYLDGVWKYDGSKVTHYPVIVDSKQVSLFSISKDNYGNLWLGSHESGVFKFDGNAFVPFTL